MDKTADQNQRLLIVDDDLELCELLQEYLGNEGFEICCRHDGQSGLETAREQEFDLLILDVMLPRLNGFDLLRRLREQSQLPVIMLTARGDDVDRIVGLELGADDYLPKPFNPRELVARIRAIGRRSHPPAEIKPNSELLVPPLRLDSGARQAWCDQTPLTLTGVEFSLLKELMCQAGRVIEREELVRRVLGRRLSPYDRSIDVHISSLRKKIGQPELIRTVRGVGYQLSRNGESGE